MILPGSFDLTLKDKDCVVGVNCNCVVEKERLVVTDSARAIVTVLCGGWKEGEHVSINKWFF